MKLLLPALAVAVYLCIAQAREFHVLGGLLLRGAPVKSSTILPHVVRTRGGCHCERGPPGGQCCSFQGAVPPPGSTQRAPCNCRACRPSYRCVQHKTPTYCVPKYDASAPRLIGAVYRPGAAVCLNKRITTPVLMPHPKGWRRKPKRKAKALKRRRAAKRRNKSQQLQVQFETKFGTRPRKYTLFVAGGTKCTVFQGGSRKVILRTKKRKPHKIYEVKGLRLRRCAPIRLRCLFSRRGVLLAIKAGGRFYGSAMPGTRCLVSNRRPKNWHSFNPQVRAQPKVVRDSPRLPDSWREFTELTGARAIRPRFRFRPFFYVVLKPPLCGKNFDGSVS